MPEKKLSKFNHVGGLKADFNAILNHLDQIFSVSPAAISNLVNFLKQNNFENSLSYDFSYHGEPLRKNASNNHAIATELKENYHELNKKKSYDAEKLIFNYTNPNWLARFVLNFVKSVEPQNKLTLERVKRFLQNSPNIKEAVMKFEKNITQMLITQGMAEFETHENLTPHRKNTVVVNEYEAMFRSKIIYTMDFLGGDLHTAELTLEENADLWRKQTMVRGFIEFSYPQSSAPSDPELYKKWVTVRDKHLKAWLKTKEFSYFHRYLSIIEEAGTITDNMKMGHFGCLHASEDCLKYSRERLAILKAAEIKQTGKAI